MDGFQAVGRVMLVDGGDDIQHGLAGGCAQDRLGEGERDPVACGGKLVEQGDRVADASGRLTCDLEQRIFIGLNLLGLDDLLQIG